MGKKARVTPVKTSREVLQRIDWSFAGTGFSRTNGLFDARKYHWYPATFIPELPYSLIEILSKPGAKVYDPFAGIGTTLYQAAILGRYPVGTEICGVAVSLIRALWELLRGFEEPAPLAEFAEKLAKSYRRSKEYEPMGRIPEALAPWYSARARNELSFLRGSLDQVEGSELRAGVSVALSATLKAVCAQDRGWGCVADNVLPKEEQLAKERGALQRFVRNMTILERDLREVQSALGPRARTVLSETSPENVVIQEDARDSDAVGDSSVDIVVTSPPYPEMTDYCMSQRLSYYWRNEDPKNDLLMELGARRKRFRSDSLKEYKAGMGKVGAVLLRKIKPEGLLCLVMPRFMGGSGNHAKRRTIVEESLAVFEDVGFSLAEEWNRALPTRRRHHNQKWTSLSEEVIRIYRRA